MIRAKATTDSGKAVIILGLEAENIRRMQAGQPVRVSGASIGLDSIETIILWAGGTRQGMEAQLREHGLIGPETKIVREHEFRDFGEIPL